MHYFWTLPKCIIIEVQFGRQYSKMSFLLLIRAGYHNSYASLSHSVCVVAGTKASVWGCQTIWKRLLMFSSFIFYFLKSSFTNSAVENLMLRNVSQKDLPWLLESRKSTVWRQSERHFSPFNEGRSAKHTSLDPLGAASSLTCSIETYVTCNTWWGNSSYHTGNDVMGLMQDSTDRRLTCLSMCSFNYIFIYV